MLYYRLGLGFRILRDQFEPLESGDSVLSGAGTESMSGVGTWQSPSSVLSGAATAAGSLASGASALHGAGTVT